MRCSIIIVLGGAHIVYITDINNRPCKTLNTGNLCNRIFILYIYRGRFAVCTIAQHEYIN